jgi:hypothetical protein
VFLSDICFIVPGTVKQTASTRRPFEPGMQHMQIVAASHVKKTKYKGPSLKTHTQVQRGLPGKCFF